MTVMDVLCTLGGLLLGAAIIFVLPFRLPRSDFRIRVVRPDRMTEKELEKALTECAETHPVYRAFMQLLDRFEDEAHDKADEDLNLPRALEAHIGGAKYIRAVRDNVLTRRANAAKRRPIPESGTV